MSSKTLQHGAVTWHWKEFGHGSRYLLAFPGFSRSPDDFHSFGKWLGGDYTILAFELFFHGGSKVEFEDDPKPLTYELLKALFDEIFKKYSIDNFEIMAYSFGGRFALNLVEIYGRRVKGLYLMAPDALRFNPGYFFSVQTMVGRYLFKKYLQNPGPVINLMKATSSLGLYSAKAMDFFINHIKNDSMRYRVYNCWMLHCNTVPDLNNVVKQIKENNIRLLLFFGKFDIIIPVKTGARFAKRTGRPDALHILEIGHRLPEKHFEISTIILHKKPR